MVKKPIFYSILFLSWCSFFAQKTSINGEIFTPRGDLKILIVFAGFEGFDAQQNFDEWPAEKEFPNYVVNGKCDELFFSDTAQFSNYPDSLNMSVSRLFYEMSQTSKNGPFKMIADVYPKRVNINPEKGRGWGDMNRMVFEEIKNTNSGFDWSPYDQRTNSPDYLYDNSVSAPDGKPDYVIVCYRYDKSWEKQPVNGMNSWIGSGGGISVLEGLYDFKFNEQYTITDAGFHMNSVGLKSTENFRRLFQHELGHELLSCPHHFGTGGTLGSYFRCATMGWGTAVNSASCTRLVNAWERWMMGWIELKHDLATFQDNGIYTIDDFATTGEAIRIKIPHTASQYLWIENHQLKSVFDQSRWTGSLFNHPIGSKGMTNIDTGLYFFVEDLMDEREKIRTYLVSDMQAVNGTKFLNANGDWDYKISDTSTQSWAEYWKHILYTFERSQPNPYDGTNPFMLYRLDANKDKKIDNSHNFNMGRATESFIIAKEKIGDSTFLFYGNHACTNEDAKRYRRTHSFKEGDVVSMCTNPTITNNPRYNNTSNRIEPTYINGIKIQILSVDKGKYTFKIEFDNNKVDQDLRIAGNVILKNSENTKIDFLIEDNIEVKVVKSQTTNTLNYNNGTFINETIFKIDSAFLQLNKGSKLSVYDSSYVKFLSASSLTINGGSLSVYDRSSLVFESGASLVLDKNAFITNAENSIVVFKKGSRINDKVLKKDVFLKNNTSYSAKTIVKRRFFE